MKPGHTGILRLFYATQFSWQGLNAAWKNEAAFRQEVLFLLPLAGASLLFPVSKAEHVALIASLVLVMIVELLNSAIEAVVDRIGSEHHELSGRAKDIGSAAVLVTMALAFTTWCIILI
ncbi:diacylglycerol kinase [Vibrio porteresiae]|uniref:Diacylglycerol kinase n=1 Tax=Vibrio porteresiae DSM 19223 TaxID=1123496 RepID=A0ABZ0QA93_9VIBR|nr:diacylglycerol kinase [Vibrio porteresiae]WPC73097.1 diacylglycerol kinase [Vibrio porteresiae DSM 19223]